MKVKHVNKKAIILYIILIVVFISIIILPMGIFHLVDYLSNKDEYIEMNDFEKEVVGIWLMDGAEWHSFSDGSYYYPDGPQGFKKEVAKYWRARNCLKPRSLNSDDLKIKKQDGFCPVFFLFVLYYFVSQ